MYLVPASLKDTGLVLSGDVIKYYYITYTYHVNLFARRKRADAPLAGCLVRAAGLVFLLIAAAIIFLFLLFGGFIVE